MFKEFLTSLKPFTDVLFDIFLSIAEIILIAVVVYILWDFVDLIKDYIKCKKGRNKNE